MAEKLYHLMNTCRSVQTRVVRANNPTHSGLKQFIGGTHRLIRQRPLVFSEELLLQHLDEIRKKHAIGMLEVRTPDGRLVDLETLEPGPSEPTPLKPAPLQDSIANDEPWGERMETVPGGAPMAEAFADTPDIDGSFDEDTADDGVEAFEEEEIDTPGVFEDPESFEEEADEEEETEEEAEAPKEASSTPQKKPRRRRKR